MLSAALSSGGSYADLYFEHRAGADYVLEDGRVRTVGRGVTLGLGVRVLRGDATGYAYTEELAEDRMLEAARTAAQIASSGAAPGPIAVRPVSLSDRYPVTEPSESRPGIDKIALLRRADAAARAFDPRVVRVEASLAEEQREVLVVTSDGHLARRFDQRLQLLHALRDGKLACAHAAQRLGAHAGLLRRKRVTAISSSVLRSWRAASRSCSPR